jgi:mlo protein
MGSSFKKAIFEENVQVGLVGWAQKVKQKRDLKAAASNGDEGSSQAGPGPDSGSGSAPAAGPGAGFAGIQLSRVTRNNAGDTNNEITPDHNN